MVKDQAENMANANNGIRRFFFLHTPQKNIDVFLLFRIKCASIKLRKDKNHMKFNILKVIFGHSTFSPKCLVSWFYLSAQEVKRSC